MAFVSLPVPYLTSIPMQFPFLLFLGICLVILGVRVREKVKGSGEFWVFINHEGSRTSRKVGSEEAAQKVKAKIEAKRRSTRSPVPK